uniref:BPTI/Kunitz inhibitor domain-containing protein n=1 Tax=Panagrolaimus sp. PS1159 TaxID=55785 RepID=A0AC35G684_9BILA
MKPNLIETFFILHLIFSKFCYSSEICWDKFDPNYKNQCLAGEWQQRYYFDHASLTCRLFWYDGCQGNSRNTFDDLLTCQWLCEEQPRYSSKSCLQQFDEHYRDECNGGRWKQQYYFDKNKKRCVSFWFDGCKGESENIFQDEITCVKMCENDAKKSESEGSFLKKAVFIFVYRFCQDNFICF